MSRISAARSSTFPRITAGVVMAVVCWAAPATLAQPQERKKAAELISVQSPPTISARLIDKVNPGNARVMVSLSKQRAYLLLGDEVVIDTPISSGKRAGMTSPGEFTILEKHKDHRSNIYGNFVDAKGRVVRAGVSTRIDSAPSGTRFLGAPMWYFMRITWAGVGLHVGHLPGYPASHGCIRMPEDITPLFYRNVKVGTRVTVVR